MYCLDNELLPGAGSRYPNGGRRKADLRKDRLLQGTAYKSDGYDESSPFLAKLRIIDEIERKLQLLFLGD